MKPRAKKQNAASPSIPIRTTSETMLSKVMNLGRLLSDVARRFPQEPGLILAQGHADGSDRIICWQEINARVDALAHALTRRGVKKGDKMLVHSRNNQQIFESAWAAFKMGVVWVPTNFRITPPEAAYLGQSSGACIMLYDRGFAHYVDAVRAASPTLQHVIALAEARPDELDYQALLAEGDGLPFAEAEVDHQDPLWFFYTSGTTGHPKAGVLSHGQMAFVVTNHLADLMPGLNHQSRSLVVAPLSHGAGVHALVNTARGAASILLSSERLVVEEAWQLVEKYRVDNLFTVPTIVKLLVEDASVDRYDHASLKHVIYAGAPMYRADQVYALKKLGRVLVQYYGLGEVTGNITFLPTYMHFEDDAHPQARLGTCGIPRTGMQIAILDDDGQSLPPRQTGEICVRGPAVFMGYHNNPEANAKAFKHDWFHTGDLGHVDEEGFLYITGRSSDMYISGGSNVYPREIEEALLTHPAVSEVAVLGVPDPKWGESGLAVIVCKPGQQVDEQALLAHLETRIGKYKWPRRFVYWETMPKSGYGKIVKKQIKALLEEQGQYRL
ncbi:acyl-CoA synthetase [Herbaspirillum rubrisubalbicans]|uniref:Acyl-CoA synthetase n=1 Tax=Herbaspirillum rubrisubalbicans TaxID=80842 RepID=A0ABX9C167_9BURK|nr:acyl-CoA synthetase [Herbaspirillum rubrisubalbicans]RAM64037.1 acyl-CoA synthetase [Herbaspirillum rubrisubalbicans]RAN46869.1 acyl-CoA synthetase [Herbaspirillum rubrisubalbicans]